MIYLCIPAHNEQQTVGVVLWKVRQVMAGLERDYQLLVADDASTDRTPDVLEPYTRVLPLTVMRNTERRGYAASLEMLLREAVARSHYPKRDAVITLQADFTDDPAHVETLVKRIESGADIVATNTLPARHERRWAPHSARPFPFADLGRLRRPRFDRWRQQLLNVLLRRLAWPDNVRDPLNGFTAYRVLCVKRMLAERNGTRLVRHEGRAANAQLLHDAAPHARRVEAVELEAQERRRWRDPRTPFPMALQQVLGLRRRREADGLLPVARLVPDEVVPGSNGRRSVFAEGLRDGDGRRGARTGRPRSQRGRRTRSRSDGAGAAGPAAEAGAESGRGRQAASSSGKKQRGERRSTPRPVGASAGPAADRDDSGDAVADQKPSRRRRSRRGGRKRRTNRTNGTSRAQDVEPTSDDQTGRDTKPPFEPSTPGA